MSTPADLSDRWLIVGAGPAGLSVCLAFRRADIAFDAVEAGASVGGLWNFDNPGSAVYESAHFISSSQRSGWADLPMPDCYPTYPRWWEIRDYIHGWSAHHQLDHHYRFHTRVESATPTFSDGTESWEVTFEGGASGRYAGVVACPGFQRVPHVPAYPGRFTGEARHSQTYKRSDEFRGRRVMVVGAGNSGVDIAVDAAIAADRAIISTRRASWFFPKLIGGVPLDHFGINSVSSQERLRQFLDIHVGDLTTNGFGRPDHLPLAHHPILNDQVLHHLSHGDLVHRPEISNFDGRAVRFVDGTTEELDLVIWATGFKDRIPFVPDEHCRISAIDEEKDLFLWMFHRRHPQFVTLGVANLAAGGYWGLAASADLIANHVRDQTADPQRWRRFRSVVEGPEPDLTGGFSYRDRPGHLNYVNAAALDRYAVELSDRFGFRPFAMPVDYQPPDLVDIDAWLDDPGPLDHGSLTPVPHETREPAW